jgi:hypothetical protein
LRPAGIAILVPVFREIHVKERKSKPLNGFPLHSIEIWTIPLEPARRFRWARSIFLQTPLSGATLDIGSGDRDERPCRSDVVGRVFAMVNFYRLFDV